MSRRNKPCREKGGIYFPDTELVGFCRAGIWVLDNLMGILELYIQGGCFWHFPNDQEQKSINPSNLGAEITRHRARHSESKKFRMKNPCASCRRKSFTLEEGEKANFTCKITLRCNFITISKCLCE